MITAHTTCQRKVDVNKFFLCRPQHSKKWYRNLNLWPVVGLITVFKVANFFRERYLPDQLANLSYFQLFVGEELHYI